jgi:FkbM family methyltransferase
MSEPDLLSGLLRPERRTAVVDIGANPIDGDPPYRQMLAAGLCTVTGFEPQPDAHAELERRKGPHETYLPYAVGDGRPHTLHVCRERGMTSLLPPDRARLALFNEFALHGLVENEIRVATRRLDDIKEIAALDFLKIDIQGGELDVFKSGRRLLARAVVVQTEVSFITLYRGQPAFGVVDTFLRGLGFVPHCFAELKFRPLAPVMLDGDPRGGGRQLLEADLVYVRDFTEPSNMDGEQWKHLALVAHHCYGSFDLAYGAVAKAVQRGGVRPDAPDQYLQALRAAGISIGRTGP